MKLKFKELQVLFIVLVAQISFAQERTVSGIAKDNANLPVSGVSAIIKGTRNGTQTDFDGKYSINLAEGSFASESNTSKLYQTGKTVTITNGKIEKMGETSRGGHTVDKISFTVEFSTEPGIKYN